MNKIKIGQIGIGHNHGEAKMLAVRKFPELFEVIGCSEENERWIEKRGNNTGYEGLPRLSVITGQTYICDEGRSLSMKGTD